MRRTLSLTQQVYSSDVVGSGKADMAETSERRGYLDWMRGVAVLVMIQAHVIDSWTRDASRSGQGFRNAVVLAGFAAPLFLFLAGVASVLAAESKRRRTGSDAIAAGAVRRRGLEIFALAFLFRLQAYLLAPGATLAGIFKVDILNIMGPSIVATATIWELARTRTNRIVALALVTISIGIITPIIREAAWPLALPDQMEWYLRPAVGRATFTIFPWAGLLVAGGLVGLLLNSTDGVRERSWMMAAFGIGGATLALVSYEMSFLPSMYARASFWTTSPTYFFLRIGIMMMIIPIAWLWDRRRVWLRRAHWSPLEELGRSSLFAYWIHVEMVYGFLSYPLHRQLSLEGSFAAWALFSLLIFGLVRLKNRLVAMRHAGSLGLRWNRLSRPNLLGG